MVALSRMFAVEPSRACDVDVGLVEMVDAEVNLSVAVKNRRDYLMRLDVGKGEFGVELHDDRMSCWASSATGDGAGARDDVEQVLIIGNVSDSGEGVLSDNTVKLIVDRYGSGVGIKNTLH